MHASVHALESPGLAAEEIAMAIESRRQVPLAMSLAPFAAAASLAWARS